MTTSTDKGATWGKSKFLTEKGYGNAKAVFDSSRNTLVVQYSKNSKGVYQVTTTNHGASWSKQTEVEVATKCGGGGVAGGGQRTITKTGRILFYSDGPGCIWYSDDGGKTYKTAPHDPMKNEVSFVTLSDGSVYGNGRSANPSWAPHRIDYRSTNNGIHWTVSKSALVDPSGPSVEQVGGKSGTRQTACGLAAGHKNTVFWSEPAGGKDGARQDLKVFCSTDGGKTWPHSISVDGEARAEYSSIKLAGNSLIVTFGWNSVFGHTVGGNILSAVVPTHWCPGASDMAANATKPKEADPADRKSVV